MGDPRRFRPKYDSPSHPWEKQRIEEENKLRSEYALKTKTEIWRAKAKVSKWRQQARELVGLSGEDRQKGEEVLLGKLKKMGVLQEDANLDAILSLKVEDVLGRRMQTIVWKKGMAQTAKQARQLIVHGHIAIKGRKVTIPGRIIGLDMEREIEWYGKPVETPVAQATLAMQPSDTIVELSKEAKPTEGEKIDAKKVLEETGASETLKHISQETEEEAPKKKAKRKTKAKKGEE